MLFRSMVALPEQAQFIQASMSASATLLVARDGRVFAWGDANAICSATAEDFSATPVPILFPKGVRILRALAGDYHCLALDATGHLWTWGNRFIGGALNPAQANQSPEPRRITLGPRDDVVMDFGMSLELSAALTSATELWTWDQFSAPALAEPIAGETAVGVSHGTSSSTLFALFGSSMSPSRSESLSDLPKSSASNLDYSNTDIDFDLTEDEADAMIDAMN